ncbi:MULTISPECIES: pyridoxal phosphate-dependent aminotransferase [Aminobacter]|jgi:aspartate aminotransferase|nr:aminotransferase class I/II-fold pyridoxal phosphate-dependent enzyme [Aminobacter sp. MDW-2]QNH35076.1 pyridoxal phosphate-dependent aminotransferase [Aminobacter sp. MDW-2]QOF69013.1 pyridoxal phosphate-dependent aminotransferase [Aminobacter sp. SR38]BBD35279.1 aspartate aminotransferase [Aminobacter sp. SS-2016]
MRRVARRISGTPQKSFGMYQKAAALAGSGRDLIHLELGRPAADTPEHIKQATIAAILAGDVHYSDLKGTASFREALAEKLRNQNGMDVSAADILVTNGLTHASFAAFLALLDPGDEAILLDPFYPQHIGKIELAGARPVFVTLDAADDFALRPELIEAAITERTRMIVLVNPVNPTGRVYSRTELEGLAELAIRRDLLVVSDEVYEDMVYDGREHVSIAALPGMAERTITAFAFTKSFAMDGWRLGYMAAPSWAMPGLLKITANDATHVNTFIQAGGRAAITGPSAVLAELVDHDRQKRDLVVRRLNQMPGVKCPSPQGAIYAFPDISAFGIPSQALAERILDEADVVVEAGSFYGRSGEGHLRVCFGSESLERLDEGMDRLSRFFNNLWDGRDGAPASGERRGSA